MLLLKEKEKYKTGEGKRKREALIYSINPEWKTLNKEVFGQWPLRVDELFHRKNK